MRFVLMFAVVLIAGCQAQQGPVYGLVCTKDVETGSIIPRQKCRTRAQMEAEAAMAKDTMEQLEKADVQRQTGRLR